MAANALLLQVLCDVAAKYSSETQGKQCLVSEPRTQMSADPNCNKIAFILV
jgi:hypothetical protein